MAAALIATPVFWNAEHLYPQVVAITKVTQSDWVVLKQFKGVIPLIGMGKASTSGASASEVTYTYGTATNTNTTAATGTSIAVTAVTAGRGATSSPFYCLCPTGEIIEVTNDSTPTAVTSTFTIKRGCLGTTAGIITAADTLAILNILFLGTAGVGVTLLPFLPLPNENQAQLFSATGYGAV